MSAAAAALSAAADGGRFGHVLDGARLDGPAARLAGLLQTGFLTRATVPEKLPQDPGHIHFQVFIGL